MFSAAEVSFSSSEEEVAPPAEEETQYHPPYIGKGVSGELYVCDPNLAAMVRLPMKKCRQWALVESATLTDLARPQIRAVALEGDGIQDRYVHELMSRSKVIPLERLAYTQARGFWLSVACFGRI